MFSQQVRRRAVEVAKKKKKLKLIYLELGEDKAIILE